MKNLNDKIKPITPFEDRRTQAQNNSCNGLFKHLERMRQREIELDRIRKRYEEFKNG